MLEIIVGIILLPLAAISALAFIAFSIGLGKAIAKMLKRKK